MYGTGEHDAQDNTVELKNITAESNVYGTHVWLGKGTAESNSVSLIGSSVSGFVVGALQEEGQGNEVLKLRKDSSTFTIDNYTNYVIA